MAANGIDGGSPYEVSGWTPRSLALDFVSGRRILTISVQVQISGAQKAAVPHQSNI